MILRNYLNCHGGAAFSLYQIIFSSFWRGHGDGANGESDASTYDVALRDFHLHSIRSTQDFYGPFQIPLIELMDRV